MSTWIDTGTEWKHLTTGDTDPGAAPVDAAALGYVGDSLTDQDGQGPARITTALTNAGWDPSKVRVDGLVGRSIIDGSPPYIPSSQTVVTTWRADGFHPRVWVIALGANDIFKAPSSWPVYMHTLLDLLADDGPEQTVYWVGQVYQPGSQYSGLEDDMQAAIVTVAAARTDLTVVPVDLHTAWAAHFDGASQAAYWSGGDGRHHTTAGYVLRTGLINQAIAHESPNPAQVGLGMAVLGTSPLGA